ncbi:MAG: MFS transporter [Eubacterium sp.]|nr:MFS transporter [Eubacterium sp.]
MSDINSSAVKQEHPCDRVFSATSIKNYISAFLGQFAIQGMAYSLFASYLSVVFTDYLGVGVAKIGIVMSIGVFVDMITDIIMGNIVDRVHTKWGKIKHWFFWMAVPVAVTIALMWMVPESSSESVKLIWALVIYNIYCTALTGVRLPTFAVPSVCSDNSKVRTILVWIASEGTNVAATITGWIITPVVNIYQDNPLQGWRLLSWIMAGITLVLLIIAGALVTEKRQGKDLERIEEERKAMKHTDKSMGLAEQYGYLFRNKYWIFFQLGGVANGMSLGFLIGSMGYWIQHVLVPAGLGGDNPIGLVMTIMNVPMMIAPFLILPLIKFLDPKQIVVLFIGLGSVFSLLMWAFGIKVWGAFLIFMILRQCVGSCVNGSVNVLLTRAIDYGEWRFGVRQEGVGSSFGSSLNKVTMGIATATLGFVLAAGGYGNEGANVAPVLNFCFMGLPGIAMAVGTFFFMMSMGGKEWAKIREELDERNSKVKDE